MHDRKSIPKIIKNYFKNKLHDGKNYSENCDKPMC